MQNVSVEVKKSISEPKFSGCSNKMLMISSLSVLTGRNSKPNLPSNQIAAAVIAPTDVSVAQTRVLKGPIGEIGTGRWDIMGPGIIGVSPLSLRDHAVMISSTRIRRIERVEWTVGNKNASPSRGYLTDGRKLIAIFVHVLDTEVVVSSGEENELGWNDEKPGIHCDRTRTIATKIDVIGPASLKDAVETLIDAIVAPSECLLGVGERELAADLDICNNHSVYMVLKGSIVQKGLPGDP